MSHKFFGFSALRVDINSFIVNLITNYLISTKILDEPLYNQVIWVAKKQAKYLEIRAKISLFHKLEFSKIFLFLSVSQFYVILYCSFISIPYFRCKCKITNIYMHYACTLFKIHIYIYIYIYIYICVIHILWS